MTVTWLIGLVVAIVAGSVVLVGGAFGIARPDYAGPAFGMVGGGLVGVLLGGLLMWLGRHAPPPVARTESQTPGTGSTDLTALPTVVDGVLDLLR
jgi:hypothetical protein